MQVLAEASSPVEWGGDIDTMDVTGQLAPMSGPYAQRWGAGGPALDCGWIGRDARGVWLTVHPETVLLDNPEVAAVYEAVCRHPEVTRADQDELAAHDYTLAYEFVTAHRRAVAQTRLQAAEATHGG